MAVDTTYITTSSAEAQIRAFLEKNFRGHTHQDYLKEEDIYAKLKELTITGVNILNVDIMYGGNEVPYIAIPSSAIPYLTSVSFTEV